ncbi:AAA family ATPase [Poseidonocella sedimentorum]|uniref:MoxR-like ATPase n=1 Tax=Poseidonocella sedimentorum TaxID=871652 RepID=A0A1I6CVY0_9RHOB|nr:AAA family ATPase [Poseidonocella sedimentorum]SFQ97379.1 MoxR-like ATPase [Poseidonocella sedimentorum]
MSLRPQDIEFLRGLPQRVEDAGMHDLGDVVRLLVVALLSGGHVLLEGNPGLGKTALVKALSSALCLGAGAVGRIQFTPDLMPSDITGTLMPDPEDARRLVFKKGPVFHELLLADEINRASPKTQAAMLEAMAEFQVTVLGDTHILRETCQISSPDGLCELRSPFMVMATQNPIDQDGTFPLPEAQLDRFMFKVQMELPGAAAMERIVAKELAAAQQTGSRLSPPPEKAGVRNSSLIALDRAARGVMALRAPPSVLTHIVNIVMASNARFDAVRGLSPRRMAALKELVSGSIEYPLGPRGAIALSKAALGWSAMVLTEPDRAEEAAASSRSGLAAVLTPVLRHRLRVTHDYGQAINSAFEEGRQQEAMIHALAKAAAPDQRVGEDPAGYADRFSGDLEAAVELHKF